MQRSCSKQLAVDLIPGLVHLEAYMYHAAFLFYFLSLFFYYYFFPCCFSTSGYSRSSEKEIFSLLTVFLTEWPYDCSDTLMERMTDVESKELGPRSGPWLCYWPITWSCLGRTSHLLGSGLGAEKVRSDFVLPLCT